MDEDLFELCSTARTLDIAARAAPGDWPPLARSMAGLCLGLAQNAAHVLRLVNAQDALIETLRKELERAHGEIAGLRAAIQAEHQN